MKTVVIDFTGRKISIIGGGKVALKRIKGLEGSGAKISLISPEYLDDFKNYDIKIIHDKYKKEYIKDDFLVIAATDNEEVNNQIYEDARSMNILCNMSGKSDYMDLVFPAEVLNGDLKISVFTSWKFPALAKYIRQDLEQRYARFTDDYLDLLEEIRAYVLENYYDERTEIFYKILEYDYDELVNYRNELIR